VTDAFEDLFHLEAEHRGLAALPCVLVDHPLGGLKPDEVVTKGTDAVEALEAALLSRG